MVKKFTTIFLILSLSMMSFVVSASSGDEYTTLTAEQKQIIEGHQKEFRNLLKKQGVDLESKEAKELLQSALENDLFSFRLLNEEVLEEEFNLQDENDGRNSPGAVWYTPVNISGKVWAGHNGVIANNYSYTYESFPDSGVVRQSNNWENRKAYSKVYLLGVWRASSDQYKKAATFAENQEDLPYNWSFTKRMEDSEYYCSQLAWRAWYEQGFNFDGNTKGIIYPSDIYKSSLTYVIIKKE